MAQPERLPLLVQRVLQARLALQLLQLVLPAQVALAALPEQEARAARLVLRRQLRLHLRPLLAAG